MYKQVAYTMSKYLSIKCVLGAVLQEDLLACKGVTFQGAVLLRGARRYTKTMYTLTTRFLELEGSGGRGSGQFGRRCTSKRATYHSLYKCTYESYRATCPSNSMHVLIHATHTSHVRNNSGYEYMRFNKKILSQARTRVYIPGSLHD